MKETAIKMHLYINGVGLDERQAFDLLTIITTQAAKAGIPMSFQIHEVTVSEDEGL
jgi:hypothetical protein